MTYSIGRGVVLRRIEIDAAIPQCWIDAVTEPPIESQSFLTGWWAFFRTTHSPPSWARWGDFFFVVLPDFRLVHGDSAPPDASWHRIRVVGAKGKLIRRLALGLDHHARGLCHKQDVVHSQPSITMQDVLQADHFQPRSPMQLLAALEVHVTSSGKELLASLKDSLCWKEKSLKAQIDKHKEVSKSLKAQIDKQEEVSKLLREMRARDQASLLQSKGLNDTRGLFEKLQEDLAAKAQVTTRLKGSSLWEAILKNNQILCDCIHGCTKIPAGDHNRQAAHCSAIYDVFLQHVHAGKELAELQAVNGDILFQRGPMSPQQVQILLCMGQAASVDIVEDPSTRHTCYSCLFIV
ncbi:hypothetical protein L7F22_064118 [Adiantum nelumboides]|nr:hypothetical protein [Adiantum nelumboides]